MSFNKIPLIGNQHSNETRNIINLMVQVINNRGIEILSDAAFSSWLDENNFKPKDAVDTFNDLPTNPDSNELRGVLNENAVYLFNGSKWVHQSNINFDGLDEVKNDVNRLDGQRISVEKFRINAEADETNLLDRSFSFASENPRTELVFDTNKVYTISSPINFWKHKYTSIHGNGAVIRVSDAISVNTPLDFMLDLSDSDTERYHVGNLYMEGVEIDGNNRAKKLINGVNPNANNNHGLYYSKFFNVKFRGIKKDGFGVYGVSWDTKFNFCHFQGYGENPSGDATHWQGIAVYVAAASNGVFFDNCNFSRLERVAEGISEHVVFENSVIDTITKAPWSFKSSNSLLIKDNYIEGTGGESEYIDSILSKGKDVNATIIFSGNPTDWASFSSGLTVENNVFANMKSSDLVALNHFNNVSITDNEFTYTPNAKNSIAYLFGVGTGMNQYGSSNTLLIERNAIERYSATPTSTQSKIFNKIIDYSSLDESNLARYGLKDIVIKDSLNFDRREHGLPINLYKGNLAVEGSNLDVVRGSTNGALIYIMTRQQSGTSHIIDLNKFYFNARGSYLRLKMKLACSQTGAGLRMIVSDGKKEALYVNNTGTLTNFSETNTLFYVDKEATELKITFSTYASVGESVYVKDFGVIPAHYDAAYYEVIE